MRTVSFLRLPRTGEISCRRVVATRARAADGDELLTNDGVAAGKPVSMLATMHNCVNVLLTGRDQESP
jgi:hypothetical protein